MCIIDVMTMTMVMAAATIMLILYICGEDDIDFVVVYYCMLMFMLKFVCGC